MKNYCSYKDLYVALKSNKNIVFSKPPISKKIKKQKNLNAFIEFLKKALKLQKVDEKIRREHRASLLEWFAIKDNLL